MTPIKEAFKAGRLPAPPIPVAPTPVKRGDTLYGISRTTGTSVRDLARLNNISPPYTIEVGQKLKLNGSSTKTTKKNLPTRTAAVTLVRGTP